MRAVLHICSTYFQIFRHKHKNQVYYKSFKVFQVTRLSADTNTNSRYPRESGCHRVNTNYRSLWEWNKTLTQTRALHMANYMLLTSEEKLFIKVQITCEHSGEYYVTTIFRLRINPLGSHARSTVFGIKYCWPICYMLHTYSRRPNWAYYWSARLHLTARTPRPENG